jgi:hypothetical protein
VLRKREEQRESAELKNVVAAEYPTEKQMEDAWVAYKKDGRSGILEFLQRQRQLREDE